MSMSHRPRLTENQIAQLKTEISFLGSTILKSIGAGNGKYGSTAALNAIAREFKFNDFSELRSKRVPSIHHESFSLVSALDSTSIWRAFKDLRHSGKKGTTVTPDVIEYACQKLYVRSQQPSEPYILIEDLYLLLEGDEYHHGHHYKKGDGYPSSFNVSLTSDFFDNLRSWDHFRVYDGEDYRCYTVEEFEHIYTKQPCFRVELGRRYENGLSLGHK